MTQILTLLFSGILAVASGQVLEKFEFSDCMTECIGDSTRIDTVVQINDITEIYLTAYANCNGNLEGQINFTNGLLNLMYTPKATMIKNKNTGEVEEVVEVAMCDCIFKFKYTITGLDKTDNQKITINGESLEDINKRNLVDAPVEIQFVVDSTWSSDDVYTVVEHSSEFPGGFRKFKEYIDSNLVYPKNAIEKGISGKVFVEFVVNKDGSIDDSTVKVLRGLDKSCNTEAIRLISQCPDWTPATIKGQPVKQKCVLPIIFNPSNDG